MNGQKLQSMLFQLSPRPPTWALTRGSHSKIKTKCFDYSKAKNQMDFLPLSVLFDSDISLSFTLCTHHRSAQCERLFLDTLNRALHPSEEAVIIWDQHEGVIFNTLQQSIWPLFPVCQACFTGTSMELPIDVVWEWQATLVSLCRT